MDLDAEARLQRLLVAGAAQGLLHSAHDCSEGGLLVALAEAAIGGAYADQGFGAECDLSAYAPGVPADSLLYGEDGARVIVSCAPENVKRFEGLCREHGVPAFQAGQGRTSLGRFPHDCWRRDAHVERSGVAQDLFRGDPSSDASSRRGSIGGSITMCGIIGVSGVPEAARSAYLGLYALQHRGQESAGIVAVDREGVAAIIAGWAW